jgi:hypothetical protein
MDNKSEATVRSEAKSRRAPPPVELPHELQDFSCEASSTNLAERMENWGSD